MYHQLTDEELLRLMREDDAAALAAIYDKYWEGMSLYVLKITQSADDASDIVQEVFVSLWNRRLALDIRGPLGPYLMAAVRNRSVRYIENNLKKRNFLASLAHHYEQASRAMHHSLEVQEMEEHLAGAIGRLPSRMREVFVLSREKKLSNKEIAARLNIAETTVKKQVSNALKALRAATGNFPAAWILCYYVLCSCNTPLL